jgi:hypothetical protein
MTTANLETKRKTLREATNEAFMELYPQVARFHGLSDQAIREEAEKKSFLGRLSFLANYFAHLMRNHRDQLRQIICVEWKYCEWREKWGQLGDFTIYGTDILIFAGIHWGPATLLWLVTTGIFDELCECNKKGILGSGIRWLFRGRRFLVTQKA